MILEQPHLPASAKLTAYLTRAHNWYVQRDLLALPVEFWPWLEDQLWLHYSPEQRISLNEWSYCRYVHPNELGGSNSRWPNAIAIAAATPNTAPIVVTVRNLYESVHLPLMRKLEPDHPQSISYPKTVDRPLMLTERIDIRRIIHELVRYAVVSTPTLGPIFADYHRVYVAEGVFKHQLARLADVWNMWDHPATMTPREWAHLVPEWVDSPEGPPGRPPSKARRDTLMAMIEKSYDWEWRRYLAEYVKHQETPWWPVAFAEIHRLKTFAKMREAWLPMLTAYRLAGGGQQP